MSQKKVFELLKELGGEATAFQISKLAKKKYPDTSLDSCVWQRIEMLRKWGYVECKEAHKGANNARIFYIKEDIDF